MLNESKNQALNYIQNDEILYIPHFFYEWDSETKKMSRIERDIFLDLRTMYFGNATANNGKIDAKDKDLLYYQLGCNTDEEKQSLEQLLKAKFKKIGNTYRHTKWDKQIKNIKWAMKNSKHGNAGNDNVFDNGQGNAMSNAERQKKLKAERKKLLADLQNIGIVLDKDVAMVTLRETHAQNFTNMDNNNGNTQSNDDGNASNAQKRANNQNNNQDKNNISLSQAGEIDLKNEQILMNNIQQWQAPTLDEMRSLLMNNNVFGVFNQETYDHCLKKFRTHYENEEVKGYFLATQTIREQKLIEWVKQERPSREYTTNQQASPKPKKLDPSKTVMLNGLAFEPLPNMTVQQTYQFVQKHKLAYEMSDEAYKRIKQEINWQQFDYQTFLNDFNQAVA